MVILHVIDIENSNGNGVATAVSNYCKYLQKYENVAIYNLNAVITSDGVNNFEFSDYKTISELPTPYNKPDIVIFNEVYKPKYIKLYKECLFNKIPYVIIPHGCLNKKAQSSKWLKKKIGNLLLFNKFIKNAEAIQFLNENEKNNSKFKYKKAIISGNGMEKFLYKNEYKNKNIVYIGRYSVKVKGLDLLVAVCKKYKKWFVENDIKIQIYGLSTEKEEKKLKKLIINNNIENVIIMNSAIFGNEKKNVLANSYCFIQLSRHEGQPMGIIEPLSVGLPCIVTYGTTLGEYVNKNKCGIGVNFNVDDVFDAIRKLYENETMRNIFSENAIVITQKIFNWDSIIKIAIKEYKEIIR